MNISSVGASQSLDLMALLSKKRRTSTSGANDTDATTDTLSLSMQAQVLAQSQGANPFRADFENLGKLIDSGDLDGAKKAYAAMQEKLQDHASDRSGTDPMADGFAALGRALDSGDTTAAQSAWTTLMKEMQKPNSLG